MNKFEIEVRPSTLGVGYENKKPYTVDMDVLKFKDGTIRVSLDAEVLKYGDFLDVKCYLESLDDLMICSQILEIVKRKLNTRYNTLIITSPIYTRYDRVMLEDNNDSFALKVFTNYLKASGYSTVVMFDNHSEVVGDLMKGEIGDLETRLVDLKQEVLLHKTVSNFSEVKSFIYVAPDKGALKKIPNAKIVANKVRDLSTGKILGVELVKNVETNLPLLVVDDLCEGGATFIGVAKVLKESHNNPLYLYVTHGLFTNNAVSKLLEFYEEIYVYFIKESVYNSLNDLEKSKVKFSEIILGA